MFFESLEALFFMNGHGIYVWSAYGLAIALMLYLGLAPVLRKKNILRQVEVDIKREQMRAEQNK